MDKKQKRVMNKIKHYCDKYNIDYPNFLDYNSIKEVAKKINNKHRDAQFLKEITIIESNNRVK